MADLHDLVENIFTLIQYRRRAITPTRKMPQAIRTLVAVILEPCFDANETMQRQAHARALSAERRATNAKNPRSVAFAGSEPVRSASLREHVVGAKSSQSIRAWTANTVSTIGVAVNANSRNMLASACVLGCLLPGCSADAEFDSVVDGVDYPTDSPQRGYRTNAGYGGSGGDFEYGDSDRGIGGKVNGCVIGGTSYPYGAQNPENLCESCSIADATGWTGTASIGSNCGFGKYCNERYQCINGCFIGGMYYAHGEKNPSNRCQTCTKESTASWTEKASACANFGFGKRYLFMSTERIEKRRR